MTTGTDRRILQVLNLVGFLGTLTINALANILPINGKTTGELSDQYPNLFVPAGITFAIWGVIYLLLAVFSLYQLKGLLGGRRPAFVDRIGWWFLIGSGANMGWILAWHYEQLFLSLLLMLTLLTSLLVIYTRLRVGLDVAPRAERLAVHLPFSIYLGWITVATIANVTALLVSINWNRFGLSELFWTVVVILVGTAITLAMLYRRADLAYSLVVIWAFAGILLKRLTVDANPSWILVGTLVAVLGLIATVAVSRWPRWRELG